MHVVHQQLSAVNKKPIELMVAFFVAANLILN